MSKDKGIGHWQVAKHGMYIYNNYMCNCVSSRVAIKVTLSIIKSKPQPVRHHPDKRLYVYCMYVFYMHVYLCIYMMIDICIY